MTARSHGARRSLAAAVATALAATSCKPRQEQAKPSPAQVASSLIDDVSPLDSASAVPIRKDQTPWDLDGCRVAPERDRGASFSELTFTGTCAFEHHGPATCHAAGDDYYAVLYRPLEDGNELELYINVEFYTGPGTYDRKVEVLALVRRGTSLYRWSNEQATVTLGYGQGGLSTSDKSAAQAQGGTPTTVQLAPTVLTAQPGTATRGTLTLTGIIGCQLKKAPR